MHRVDTVRLLVLLVVAPLACASSKQAKAVGGDDAPKAIPPLRVSVAPMASGDLGQNAPLELTLKNAGATPMVVALPDESHLKVSARDSNGRAVVCRTPAPAAETGAQLQLQPGEAHVFKVDLLKQCDFAVAGKYALEVRYLAPGASAQDLGGGKTTLLLAAQSIPWKNPGPLSPGQTPKVP